MATYTVPDLIRDLVDKHFPAPCLRCGDANGPLCEACIQTLRESRLPLRSYDRSHLGEHND